jgi:antirestriction protein ArdC
MNATYEIITNKFIEALESGIIPWRKPWKATDGPRNLRGTAYRGVNSLLLNYEMQKHNYSRNIWMTPNQAIELRGSFKGQKTTMVIFWKIGKAVDEKTGEEQKTFLLRYYNVLNIDQVLGVEIPADPELLPLDPIELAEETLQNIPNCPDIKHGGNEAYYSPTFDYVQMPPMNSFKNSEAYYAVLFHELGHSTGHATRLGRFDASQDHNFGSADYSKEELVAEMTSNFICSELGIHNDFDNSAAYIQSWITVLKNEKTWIISAASKAEKAADYILGHGYNEIEAGKALPLSPQPTQPAPISQIVEVKDAYGKTMYIAAEHADRTDKLIPMFKQDGQPLTHKEHKSNSDETYDQRDMLHPRNICPHDLDTFKPYTCPVAGDTFKVCPACMPWFFEETPAPLPAPVPESAPIEEPAALPVTVSCLAENLYKAMKEVQITKESTLPVLNHVHLAIVDGRIELTTTDLEEIYRAECGCRENDSAGASFRWSTCVPMVHTVKCWRNGKDTKRKYSPFLDWLKIAKDCNPLLTMTFDPAIQTLTFRSGTSKTTFKCLDEQEFPPCKR